MLIFRLIHLKDLPSYEHVLDALKNDNLNLIQKDNNLTIDLSNNKKKINEISKVSKDQIKNTTQQKPFLSSLKSEKLIKNKNLETILSFEDLIHISSKKKDVHLKYDLENNVNLIKFSEGKIDISFNENLDKDFVRNLSKKLFEWTGNRWVITLAKELGKKTFSESKKMEKDKFLENEKKGEIYKKFKNIFSDGELLEVKKKN